jgi:muramoyltetrapeptide carboxypeptidase LdcA involved in peptidoglycan recycling
VAPSREGDHRTDLGGNLEIFSWNLAADRWIRPVDDYAGCVLLLETSEEGPSAQEVSRMLSNAGERGLLAQFPAVIVGLAKAANFGEPADPTARERYRDEQHDAILTAFEAYNPDAMIVFGVDIGHTDPQWVLPYGGPITIDGPARTITAHYSPKTSPYHHHPPPRPASRSPVQPMTVTFTFRLEIVDPATPGGRNGCVCG